MELTPRYLYVSIVSATRLGHCMGETKQIRLEHHSPVKGSKRYGPSLNTVSASMKVASNVRSAQYSFVEDWHRISISQRLREQYVFTFAYWCHRACSTIASFCSCQYLTSPTSLRQSNPPTYLTWLIQRQSFKCPAKPACWSPCYFTN
jgi:hypothetical protein